MNKLLAFYYGGAPDDRGRLLAEMTRQDVEQSSNTTLVALFIRFHAKLGCRNGTLSHLNFGHTGFNHGNQTSNFQRDPAFLVSRFFT